MKKLNKVAVMLAALTLTGAAFAAEPGTIDNWRNADNSLVWKNGTSELCWRNAFWTPATAAAGCDGALAAVQPTPPANPTIQPRTDNPPPRQQQAEAKVVKVNFNADAFFDFDKSVLKPEGRSKLDDLVGQLKGVNLEVIIAVGHTDSIGSVAYNQKLSVRRAEAVKAYLVSKGIEQSRVYTEGKGKSQPVADNKTREGRAQNRRVTVEVVGTRTER